MMGISRMNYMLVRNSWTLVSLLKNLSSNQYTLANTCYRKIQMVDLETLFEFEQVYDASIEKFGKH
jgi:hypothetical protein